jgi:formylmethanofuran dehydrogenase subunit A
MTLTRLSGGTIYDPQHGVDGATADLWIENGKIVAAPPSGVRADVEFDLRGFVVMPGGIDMHCHIAGPKVNTARKMLPELRRRSSVWKRTANTRSGTCGVLPSTFATGYLYAGLGYTTAIDAAIPPLVARHAIEEFHDTPILDKGFLVLVGNHQYAMERIANGEQEQLTSFLGWLLTASKGWGAKVVNPAGLEQWKASGGNVTDIDQPIDGFNVTGRQIVTALTLAADTLRLPHPVHIHCNNLGLPGNWATTLETMKGTEGQRGHFTHIQFHSYGGALTDQAGMCSMVPQLADYVNQHSNITVDVGQVMFGETCSMTGDGPLGHYLHKVTGSRKWFSGDVEQETGCGIVPIKYQEKSLIHALQFAIGLEWYLLVNDPWRIAMSTDHPNGAAFLSYPQIIALLMDYQLRKEWLDRLPPGVKQRTVLADLTREYTLSEIAIITRAAPARILGLPHKGHLGLGADADITVYSPAADKKQMFEFPRYLFKSGTLVIDDGEVRATPDGELQTSAPQHHQGDTSPIKKWFEAYYTVAFNNFQIDDEELGPFRRTSTK